MGKKHYQTPPQIMDVVAKERPEPATHYRFLDSQHRAFPPTNQLGYLAIPRVEVPSVPPGRYWLRFETSDGMVVSGTNGDELPEVELGEASEMKASPVDLEVYRERQYQKIEKREHVYRRDAIHNETLNSMMKMLVESHQMIMGLAKAQLEAAKDYTAGQQELFQQQNELLKQTRNLQPPAREDWSGAVKAVVSEVGSIVKTGIAAAAAKRVPMRHDALPREREPLPALPGPVAPLDTSPAPPPLAVPPTASPVASSTARETVHQTPSVEVNKAKVPTSQVAESAKSNSESAQTARAPSPSEQAVTVATDAQRPLESADDDEMPSPFGAAWREIKRRVVGVTDEGIAWILSSPENFVDFLKYVSEPCPRAEEFVAEAPA